WAPVLEHRHRRSALEVLRPRDVTVLEIGIGVDVGDLGERTRLDGTGRGTGPAWRERICAAQRPETLGRHAVCRGEVNEAATEPENARERSGAQVQCAPGNGVEHGLHVRWRAGDDAEDLADSSLVLERFLELALASLHGLEQPGVLYGDHRLVGEGL